MRILRILPTIDPSFGRPMNGARNFDRLFRQNGITAGFLNLNAPDELFIKEYGGNVIAFGPSLFFIDLSSLNSINQEYESLTASSLSCANLAKANYGYDMIQRKVNELMERANHDS